MKKVFSLLICLATLTLLILPVFAADIPYVDNLQHVHDFSGQLSPEQIAVLAA